MAGAASDLDGLSLLGGWDTYYRYHHILFHNVGSLVVVAAVSGLFLWRRPWAWLLVTFAFGMHLVEDYLTIPWAMYPWMPFNRSMVNLGQHFPAWIVQYVFQSVAMLGIVAATVWIYVRHHRTPIEIASPALDRLILNYAVLPLKSRCSSCAAKPHFRCDRCGRTFCGRHATVVSRLEVRCAECRG